MSKMKKKEMFFDLESSELIEMDEQGNPVTDLAAEGTSNEGADEKLTLEEAVIKEEDPAAKNNQPRENSLNDEKPRETNKGKKKNQNQQIKNSKGKAKDPKGELDANKKAAPNKNNKNKKNNKNNKNSLKDQTHRWESKSAFTQEEPVNAKDNQREEKLQELFLDTKEKLSEGKEKLSDSREKFEDFAQEMTEKSKQKADAVMKSAGPAMGSLGKKTKDFFTSIKNSVSQFFRGLSSDVKEGGLKKLVERNKVTLMLALLVIVIGGGIYAFTYQRLPSLSENHAENSGGNYKTYDAEVHPMQILSTVRENMTEFKGEPSSKGDGKSDDTKYVVYSLDWFGQARKTVIYYDGNNAFNRIKLEIDNESATSIYEKLTKELGTPLEDHDPTVREGWAVWIKDSIKYKMMHRGSYTQVDMTIAKYDNSQNLPVGKYPVLIQNINNIDLNGDKVIDEKILLLGNREVSTNINFDNLYLLVWDGKKTHVKAMSEEYDGGSFPQIEFYDQDKDGAEDIVVSSENNIVNHYNVFKYTGTDLSLIYSGYEEPGLNE